MNTLRITAKNSQEIEGLGYELTECSDREAELFALEELQPDGRWLTLEEYATRSEADWALTGAVMTAPLVLGPIIVTIREGKCGSCDAMRMVFVNHLGRTKCAGCAALERAEDDERVGGEERHRDSVLTVEEELR